MEIEFEMTDFGLMKYFLGVEVEQSNNGIFICQQKYDKIFWIDLEWQIENHHTL